MSEANRPSDQQVPAQPVSSTSQPTPHRRRRRWAWVILGLVMTLLLLLILLPTILSTDPVRNLVLGQVNKQLPGRITVDDWSLGWVSGIELKGIRLFDAEERQVGEVRLVKTEASLLGVARGNYDIGETIVDGLDANYPEVMGAFTAPSKDSPTGDAAQPSTPSPDPKLTSDEDKAREPLEVPSVRGRVKVTNTTLTITPSAEMPPVQVRAFDADINIPDINGPIESSVKIIAASTTAGEGTFTTSGKLDLFEDNKLATDSLQGQQTVNIAQFDLAALAPVLPRESIERLTGVANGEFALTAQGSDLKVDGAMRITNVVMSGPALKGDTFRSSELVLSIPNTTYSPAGDAPRLTIGENAMGGPVELRLDQGNVGITGELPIDALGRIASNQPPGATGRFNVNADFDLAKLAQVLPNTLGLQQGVQVRSGKFTSQNQIDVQPEHATVSSETRLTDIAGANAGRPVRLQPIVLTLTAKAVAGTSTAEALRDLSLGLQSAFAQAEIKGATLTALSGSVNGQLDAFQREVGQIVDFGGMEVAGAFRVDIKAAGDVTTGNVPPVQASVALTGLNVKLPDPPPTTQPAGETGEPPKKPLPPLRVLVDRFGLVASLHPQGQGATIDGVKLTSEKLAVERGEPRYDFQPINLSLAAKLDGLADPKTIDVTQLAGSVGVAELTMPEPIRVTSLDTTPAINGAIRLGGQIEQITRLLETMNGQAHGTELPYEGTYVVTQTISTSSDTITPRGTVDVTDLRVFDKGQQVLTEPKVTITNDLALDTSAKSVAIKALNVETPQSGAIKLAVTGGVKDWETTRQFQDLKAVLDYDLERLWAILRPMVSEEGDALADSKMSGRAQRTFTVAGSYPAGEFKESIKHVTLAGGFVADHMEVSGLIIDKLDVPIHLTGGTLATTTADGKTASPAACNGGTIDLGGISVDLKHESPRLTIPEQKKLLAGVALNDALVQTLNQAVLVLSEGNAGASKIDLTVVQCNDLPMGEALKSATSDAPPAEFLLSFTNIQLGGKLVEFADVFARGDWREQMRGDVRDTRITIANGVTTIQNFVLEGGQQGRDLFSMLGSVALPKDGPLDLNITLPAELLKGIDRNILKYLPEGVTLPVTGTKEEPQVVNADRIIRELVGPALQRYLIDQAMGGGDKPDQPTNGPPGGDPNTTTQPAPEQRQPDPVGGIIDLLRKREEEKKEKEQERRERRRKKREAQQPQ